MSVSLAVADVRRIAHGPMRTMFIGLFLKSLASGLTLALIVLYLSTVRDFPISVATSPARVAGRAGPGRLAAGRDPRRPLRTAARPARCAAHRGDQPVRPGTGHDMAAGSAGDVGGRGRRRRDLGAVGRPARPPRPVAGPVRRIRLPFMLLNLGIGLGGLISATIVDIDRPSTFELLYALNALGFLAIFVAVLAMGDVGGLPAPTPASQQALTAPLATARARVPQRQAPADGWATVLRDRNLRRFAAAALLMLTFGYGSIDSGVALFITQFVGLDESRIGLVFAANTAVIVAGAAARDLVRPGSLPGADPGRRGRHVGPELGALRVGAPPPRVARPGGRPAGDVGLRGRRDAVVPGRAGAAQRPRPRAPAWPLQRLPVTPVGGVRDPRAADHRAVPGRPIWAGRGHSPWPSGACSPRCSRCACAGTSHRARTAGGLRGIPRRRPRPSASRGDPDLDPSRMVDAR